MGTRSVLPRSCLVTYLTSAHPRRNATSSRLTGPGRTTSCGSISAGLWPDAEDVVQEIEALETVARLGIVHRIPLFCPEPGLERPVREGLLAADREVGHKLVHLLVLSNTVLHP